MGKYKSILVIGNGFDLDLNLKTKYSDFAKSTEWKELFSKEDAIRKMPLLQYLYGKSFVDNWYDIEKALFEYAQIKADGSYVHENIHDKEGYELISKTFGRYLKQHVLSRNHPIHNTIAGKLLSKICSTNSYSNCKIYSFNYTPIDFYGSMIGCLHLPEIEYIHGNIDDNSFILGIENVDIHCIAPGYSFLFKSNNINYKSTSLITDITDTEEIIIFGLSLSDFDISYFKDFFYSLSRKCDKQRYLTFITYDEDSKNKILDNIRKSYISVISVFQHSVIRFILTSHMSNKESPNYHNFQELLHRI